MHDVKKIVFSYNGDSRLVRFPTIFFSPSFSFPEDVSTWCVQSNIGKWSYQMA